MDFVICLNSRIYHMGLCSPWFIWSRYKLNNECFFLLQSCVCWSIQSVWLTSELLDTLLSKLMTFSRKAAYLWLRWPHNGQPAGWTENKETHMENVQTQQKTWKQMCEFIFKKVYEFIRQHVQVDKNIRKYRRLYFE